jgi:hypothetical protein
MGNGMDDLLDQNGEQVIDTLVTFECRRCYD